MFILVYLFFIVFLTVMMVDTESGSASMPFFFGFLKSPLFVDFGDLCSVADETLCEISGEFNCYILPSICREIVALGMVVEILRN